MPEVLTKHPDVVLSVLKGGGARCGEGLPQKILTKCPPARFCKTSSGELCVYGLDDLSNMTQVRPEDLAGQVCGSSNAGGCSLGSPPAAVGSSELALSGVVLVGLLAVRRWRRRR
jgi:hypothetical protein